MQYVVRRSSALGTSRQGFTANLNLNTSYKLKKGWTVQGYAYSGLRTIEIQGFGPANLYYQLGAKKVFWKEKADLTLNFASPFNRFWPYTSTTTTPVFDETFTYRADGATTSRVGPGGTTGYTFDEQGGSDPERIDLGTSGCA